jgi:hypothetical protein
VVVAQQADPVLVVAVVVVVSEQPLRDFLLE